MGEQACLDKRQIKFKLCPAPAIAPARVTARQPRATSGTLPSSYHYYHRAGADSVTPCGDSSGHFNRTGLARNLTQMKFSKNKFPSCQPSPPPTLMCRQVLKCVTSLRLEGLQVPHSTSHSNTPQNEKKK